MPAPSDMPKGQKNNYNLIEKPTEVRQQSDAPQRRMVITVENSNHLAEALHEVNFSSRDRQVWTLSPKAADRLENNKVSAFVSSGAVDMLAVELPVPGKDIKPDKATHFYRTVNRWIALSRPFLQKGMVILIFGTFCRHWQEPMLDDMIQAGVLHKSYHRLCHFKIKVGQQDAPSSACFVAASNVKLEGHRCKCTSKAAGDHMMDWNSGDSNHQRHTIRAFMLGKILGQLKTTTSSSTTPDSLQPSLKNTIEAYPTEARARQKERLKAGHEIVKKKQVIEDHFDDCGSSLDGLRKICPVELFMADFVNDDGTDGEHLWLPELPGLFNSVCFHGVAVDTHIFKGAASVTSLHQLEAVLYYNSRPTQEYKHATRRRRPNQSCMLPTAIESGTKL